MRSTLFTRVHGGGLLGCSASVGVGWQTVVAVGINAVMLLACLLYRIDVYHGPAQVAQVVQQTVVDLAGYGVPFCHRQLRVHRHVHLGVQSVPQPPRPDLRDVFHAVNLASGVPYLLYGLGLDPVEQAGEDGLARLPDDHQDGRRYQEPHDGVGQRVAQPHPHGPGQDGEARPAVGPGVTAVGDESGAPYLPADSDAEHGTKEATATAQKNPTGCGLMSRSMAWY